MKTLALLLVTLCGTLVSANSQAQNSFPDSTIKDLKAGIEGFKNRYHSPSIVVAIVHDKEIIFSHSLGYMDLENKIPAGIDSKYPILSVTKTFTATIVHV